MSNSIKAIEKYLVERQLGKKPAPVTFDFTLAALRKLPIPEDKEYIVKDGNGKKSVSGLTARVTSNAAITLQVHRRPKGYRGAAIRNTLCNVNQGIPIADIRVDAAEYIRRLNLGQNPLRDAQESRETERQARSVAAEMDINARQAIDQYLDGHVLGEKSIQNYKRHIFLLGDDKDRPLREIIDREFLTQTLPSRIVGGKSDQWESNRGAGLYHSILKTLRAITNDIRDNQFEDYGESFLPEWPIRTSKTKKIVETKTALTPRIGIVEEVEMPAFVSALFDFPAKGASRIDREMARDQYLFLCLTGTRSGETGKALFWENIDLEKGTFYIPAQSTKGRKPLAMPMSDYVQEMLVRRHRITGMSKIGLVFPNYDFKAIKKYLRKKTGIHHINPHSLRRLFKSLGVEAGVDKWLVDVMANHGKLQTVSDDYIQVRGRLKIAANQIAAKFFEQAKRLPSGSLLKVVS